MSSECTALAGYRYRRDFGRLETVRKIYVELRETPPPAVNSPADLAELAPVPILVCDLDQRLIRYANRATAALFGRDAGELVGSPLDDLLHPSESALPAAGATRTETGSGTGTRCGAGTRGGAGSGLPGGEYTVHPAPGGDRPEPAARCVEARATPVTFDGMPCAQVVLFDITERVSWERRLAHQASHDTLTGLPNAWYAGIHLHRVLGAATDEPAESIVDQLAVFFIDLNGFKQINDVYGHHVGDAVLRQTAHRLRAAAAGAELTARLHGDEFLAVCRVANAIHADYLARRIRQALARPIAVGQLTVGVTASVGIAVSTPGTVDADRLLRFADHRMYTDKRRPGSLAGSTHPAGDNPVTSAAPAATPRAARVS